MECVNKPHHEELGNWRFDLNLSQPTSLTLSLSSSSSASLAALRTLLAPLSKPHLTDLLVKLYALSSSSSSSSSFFLIFVISFTLHERFSYVSFMGFASICCWYLNICGIGFLCSVCNFFEQLVLEIVDKSLVAFLFILFWWNWFYNCFWVGLNYRVLNFFELISWLSSPLLIQRGWIFIGLYKLLRCKFCQTSLTWLLA